MNNTLRSAFLAGLLGLSLVSAFSGCRVTAETLTQYNGTEVQKPLAWTANKPVSISNTNGDVYVGIGNDPANVVVVAKPFTMSDTDVNATNEMNSRLQLVTAEENGVLVIKGVKSGGVYPGWNLKVFLPPAFNGDLSVNQNNGALDVRDVGAAPHANIVADNGPADLHVGNAVVDVAKTGPGSLIVNVAGAGEGNIRTTSSTSDLLFEVPAGAQTIIKAWSKNGAKINLQPAAPAGWVASGETDASKTFVCNGGGKTYNVTIEDPDSLGDMTIQAL